MPSLLRKVKRRHGEFKEKWVDLPRMLKHSYQYVASGHSTTKKENWGNRSRNIHTKLIKEYKVPHMHLKSTKEVQQFLEEALKENHET